MICKSIFRQYDIRGIVPKELTKENSKLIGYYLGLAIQERTKVITPYIVVGYDIRKHSTMLFESLVSGLNQSGCKILNIGLVATGVNYFASYQEFEIDGKTTKPQASIMITGSHNAKQYNGFKITIENQPYFADDLIKLYEAIKKNENINILDNKDFIEVNAKSLYIDYMCEQFKGLKNLKQQFVVDCGNGMADTVITEIFDKLNLNYKALYTKPNGDFPNHHPDPSNEKNLEDLKSHLKDDCNYGFAYDGDADRIAVLTQKHNIKGDILALLFSKTMKNPVIIGEVTYSQNVFDEINTHGTTIMDKTGYSNLRLKLQELNADLAAEVSGHIFFNDRYYGFDDAIYATFRVLELIQGGMKIDEEIEKLPKIYTSSNIEIKIDEDKKFLLMEKIEESLKRLNRDFPLIKDICKVDGLRINFAYGWALVRASNTNPILVTKYEASTFATAKTYQNSLEKLIQKEIDELNSTTS
ncbi:phosphomannomutase/phosphoglucomutase [Poseidonibacter ostreae]|uniref:Phosphomannomutase/phosphoglucomutase n=1 Tax=Poseidonibacter ostreae TaxID=2654171 RepID=A0A6L4WUS5_9BACT|nr:phosphomannomutase/phosphoglucomutase [Poseidonibacter ostreae]KAB7886315.1 phosphomannomutase/phosphoglucomutase [Poseidonibacter ostreae]KAB7890020.1 phosphomannomutase/phosphoglucomutase [Poseidonibacter ostreae]